MAAQGGGSGSEKGAEGDEALAQALKNLELREGELDDGFTGEEDLHAMKKEARWLAVAIVHTSNGFSAESLFQTLRLFSYG
jgi:hypothetical protein